MTALTCFFITGLVWLHPSRRTGHPRFPIEVESGLLYCGSRVRLPFPPAPLLWPTSVWLLVEQVIYKVNSFQLTRSAMLILAYRQERAVHSLLAQSDRRIDPRRPPCRQQRSHQRDCDQ